LVKNGIPRRSKSESVSMTRPALAERLRGKKRPPRTEEWSRRISESKRRAADETAAGVSYKTGGYVEYTRGPNAGRSVHVVMMEEKIGRRLAKDEVVHHIDENKHNNDIDNLQLMTRSEHARHHRINERNH
jgi:hypothetical protein